MITLHSPLNGIIRLHSDTILAVKINESARTVIECRALNDAGMIPMFVRESASQVVQLLEEDGVHMEISNALTYRPARKPVREEDLVELPI